MKLKYVRGYQRFQTATEGIFHNNPILVCGLALPFAVVPTTSLNSGVSLCIAMIMSYVPVVFVASLLGKHIPLWLRTAIYPIMAALLLIPTRYVLREISPTILSSLGIYFSLLATSTMLTAGVERAVKVGKIGLSLKYAVCNAIGFCMVVLSLSFLRELFGSGSLWGVPIKAMTEKTPTLLIAAGGFILLGMVAAFFKMLNRMILSILLRAAEVEKSVHLAD